MFGLDIVAFFKGKGVDYDVIHKECYARYGKSHEVLANWSPEDFDFVVVDNKKAFKIDGVNKELKVQSPVSHLTLLNISP